jgi:uncharacterized membrane protein YqiK
VLGDARIYAFPGANGNGSNGAPDVNKLLFSTSGLALINTLLEDGKLAALIAQVKQLMSNDGTSQTQVSPSSAIAPNPIAPDTIDSE